MQVLAATLTSIVVLESRAPSMLPRVHQVLRAAHSVGGVVAARVEALERVVRDSGSLYVLGNTSMMYGESAELAWPRLDFG